MISRGRKRKFEWMLGFLLLLSGCLTEGASDVQIVEDIAKSISSIFLIDQVEDARAMEAILKKQIKKTDAWYEVHMRDSSLVTCQDIDMQKQDVLEGNKRADGALSHVSRIQCGSVTFNPMGLDGNIHLLRAVLRLLIVMDTTSITLLPQRNSPFSSAEMEEINSVMLNIPAKTLSPAYLSLQYCSRMDYPLILQVLKRRIIRRIELICFSAEEVYFLDEIFWAPEYTIAIILSPQNKQIHFSALARKQLQQKETMPSQCVSLEVIGEESQLESALVGIEEFCLVNEKIVLHLSEGSFPAQDISSNLSRAAYSAWEQAVMIAVVLGSLSLANVLLWRLSS